MAGGVAYAGQLCLCPHTTATLAPLPLGFLLMSCLVTHPWLWEPPEHAATAHRGGRVSGARSPWAHRADCSPHLGVSPPCPSPPTAPTRCRFVGRPGDYVYIFRSFRMEEVSLCSVLLSQVRPHSGLRGSRHSGLVSPSSQRGGQGAPAVDPRLGRGSDLIGPFHVG